MNKSSKKPVIGILGGIGAGKSTVAAELVALGCAIIDADTIGHELLDDSEVRRQLRNRWADDIFTSEGRVDRYALGRIVFADAAQLEALNAIMHPRMRELIERGISRASDDQAVLAIVIDAAILLQARWDDLCTHLVFVDASDNQRSVRTMEKRAWRKDDWKRREEFQISLDKKAQMCDYTISNRSSISCLQDQVREFFQKIVHA